MQIGCDAKVGVNTIYIKRKETRVRRQHAGAKEDGQTDRTGDRRLAAGGWRLAAGG
jgi:hypothetical protein